MRHDVLRCLLRRRHRSQDWRRSICPYFLWAVISMPIITLNDRLSGWKDTRLWGLSLCSCWLIDDERWCEFHTLVTTWWLCRALVGIFHNSLMPPSQGSVNLCCQMWFLNWLSWILIAVNRQLVGQVMDESATVHISQYLDQYRGKECSVVCFEYCLYCPSVYKKGWAGHLS